MNDTSQKSLQPVTVENFCRAESDMYMGSIVKTEDCLGQFHHNRELFSVDHQTVVRGNRDTLYSMMVADLDAGPVTITLPEGNGRFMSLMALNQDHYVIDVRYGAGSYTYDRHQAETRYLLIGLRTLANPNDENDMMAVRALQDAVTVTQTSGGKLEMPEWDPESQKKVRDALKVLGTTTAGFSGAFGNKGEVDPVLHLIGCATGWGGNPEKDAKYVSFWPEKNDGSTKYRLTVKDVPVDAFWSISVYDEAGYFKKNDQNSYTINNLTAKKEPDGSVVVHFGGCGERNSNCLPIMPGWNYLVRLYRPRPEILDGSWAFPQPGEVG